MSKELIPLGDQRQTPMNARALDLGTCERWKYHVADHKGKTIQVANYFNDRGQLVAQKCRTKDKDFFVLGNLKDALPLYGQWLWKEGGKRVVITEGEIDALSVSQAQDNRWPVVSVPNGAQGAAKAVSKAIEWLETFDEVVFMLDDDEPGQKATQECVQLLSPGKAKIAQLPRKDANECLKHGEVDEIIRAIWNAKSYRPDGIVTLADIKQDILKPIERGLPWWLEPLDKLTYGRRTGECYAFGAGTGVGKTDFLTQQVVYDVVELDQPVALFFLEQQPIETAKRVAGKYAGKRFWIPDGSWSDDELMGAIDTLEKSGKLYMFNHFGAGEWDIIKNRIRFLARSEGVKLFYLDHLTALAAAEEDERTGLERIMAEIGGLVKELDIVLHFVSHLSTPDGKPHEEGGRVMIRHFKGSRTIGYWSHFMFGLERDQQAEDEEERQTTTFRVLKDRLTGQATGKTIFLGYDAESARLYPQTDLFEDETSGGDDCPF